MPHKIPLQKKPNFTRALLLAPFSKRYSAQLALKYEATVIQMLVRDVIQTRDNRLVYIKNAKAGCSTVAEILYYYDHGKPYRGENIHRETKTLQQGIQYADRAVAAIKDPTKFKFSVVRHPQGRVVSAFKNFVLQSNNRSAPRVLHRLKNFGYQASLSNSQKFDVFIDFVTESFRLSLERTDPHFRLQKLNIGVGLTEHDKVIRLENLQTELESALKQAGGWHDNLIRAINLKRNASASQFEFTPNRGQVKRIEELYAPDYDVFGY